MNKKTKCKYVDDEYEVCNLLDSFVNNGWNLNDNFIDIAKGISGFYVFYDERMEKPYKSNGYF